MKDWSYNIWFLPNTRLNFKIFPTNCAKRVVFADEKFNPKLVFSHLFLVDIGHNSDNKIANFFSLLISKPRFDHENLSNLLNLSAYLITNSSVFFGKRQFSTLPFFSLFDQENTVALSLKLAQDSLRNTITVEMSLLSLIFKPYVHNERHFLLIIFGRTVGRIEKKTLALKTN